MSNRLLIPKHLRSPCLNIPGIVPASPGNGARAAAAAGLARTLLQTFVGNGQDNIGGLITTAFNVSPDTMIVLDVTRDGPGDIDATGGSIVTNNKGLTFVKQSAVARVLATPGAWYRLERWWAYTASAQTGMTVSVTFNRTGTNSSCFLLASLYGYTNIPKANGGAPFYSNGGLNPATGINTTDTVLTMTAMVDPRGIAKSVCVASSIHQDRDALVGTSGAGTGMSLIHIVGPHNSSGQSTFVNEDLISNAALGATQAMPFAVAQANWLVLADVIDAT